jgi:hypothetical protein
MSDVAAAAAAAVGEIGVTYLQCPRKSPRVLVLNAMTLKFLINKN